MHFKIWKKGDGQTNLEFAWDLFCQFACWCNSLKVPPLELCDLIGVCVIGGKESVFLYKSGEILAHIILSFWEGYFHLVKPSATCSNMLVQGVELQPMYVSASGNRPM